VAPSKGKPFTSIAWCHHVRPCLLLALASDCSVVMPGLHFSAALALRRQRAIDRGYTRHKRDFSAVSVVQKNAPATVVSGELASSGRRGRWADIEDGCKDHLVANPSTTLCGAADSQVNLLGGWRRF
jgi:hypothetical protein